MQALKVCDIPSENWPIGSVIITANQKGCISSAIRFFQSLLSGQPANRSHVLFFSGMEGNIPLGLSQNWRVVKQPLNDYAGCRITVAWNREHSQAARDRMISEALTALGRRYDWPGIIGQALASLTGIRWLRRKFQLPWRTFCSEFVTVEIRRNLEPAFVGNIRSAQVNPDEMDLWVRQNWEWRSYELT